VNKSLYSHSIKKGDNAKIELQYSKQDNSFLLTRYVFVTYKAGCIELSCAEALEIANIILERLNNLPD